MTPEKKLREWNAFQNDHEKDIASSKAIEDQLRLFHSTLAELHILSEREDVTWDHRIRDLSGSGLYHYMLPELQQTRDLGRLLRWQAIERLQRGDFEGTIQSVRSGFRLAYLVRSGETVIQQLVANAIEAMMEEALLVAIQQPGCPSLYWALATVPQDSESMCRALQIEMSAIGRMLSVFSDNEQVNTDRKYWQAKWRESFQELVSLGSEENAVLGLSTTLALECAAVTTETRSQLIAEGLIADQIESMCPEQIVAITTQREIRRVCDELMRSFYLPTHQAVPRSTLPDVFFRNTLELYQAIRISSVVVRLLIPATNNIQVAAVNRIASRNRLMTIEAIRLYATKNDGGLPETLEDLSPVPAFVDPFTNKLIRYKKGTENGVETATLEIDRPNYPEYLRQLKLQIAK